MEYALEIEGLCKAYPDFCLDNISFQVPRGAIVGLIGENGAGKTTTIRTALGLSHADAGTVRFFGQRMEENEPEVKRRIGVAFDSLSFSQIFTAKQVDRVCAGVYPGWDSQRFYVLLNSLGLPQSKRIKDMSKGMRAKFSLAVTMSHGAELLILDEPTSGLDPVMRDDILDLFLDYVQDERRAILLSSHITSDLEKIADYIVFIHEGKVIFSVNKDELLYRYGILRCGRDRLADIDPADMLAYRLQDYQCSVLVADREEAARKYPEMVTDRASLDEIMLFYVKGEAR